MGIFQPAMLVYQSVFQGYEIIPTYWGMPKKTLVQERVNLFMIHHCFTGFLTFTNLHNLTAGDVCFQKQPWQNQSKSTTRDRRLGPPFRQGQVEIL